MTRLAAMVHLAADATSAAQGLASMQAASVISTTGGWIGQGGAALTGPQMGKGQDGCLLAGDLDLTDTDTLGLQLGLTGADDATLVLAAYHRWGTDAPDHLEGAFAFVLWDAQRARLFAARDRFGIKPLVFHASPRAVYLASDISAVIGGLGQTPTPDENWIADFLAGYVTNDVSTAYRGIDRLPPGHLLILERGRVQTRRWWHLEPRDLARADLHPEALQDALAKASIAALRGGPVAAMLSGGLDSSSLSLLAQKAAAQPLPVFSLRFPNTPALDEGRYIAPVLAAGRFAPHDLNGETGSAMAEMDSILAEQGQPFGGFGILTNRRIYRAAAATGHRVIIDGHGGDEVIGSGYWHLDALAARGDWLSLWRLLRQRSAFLGKDSAARLMAGYLARHANRPIRRLARPFDKGPVPDAVQWRALLNADLTTRSDLVARVNQAEVGLRAGLPPIYATHAALIAGHGTATAFEVLDRAAAANGITARYPFFDRRVVDLCLNQPSAAKFANGQPRALLRQAMAGVLPDAVRLRSDKVDFLPNIWRGLREDPEGRLAGYAKALPDRLAPYVDATRLRAAADRLTHSDPDITATFHLWRAAWLDRWLQSHEQVASNGTTARSTAEAAP